MEGRLSVPAKLQQVAFKIMNVPGREAGAVKVGAWPGWRRSRLPKGFAVRDGGSSSLLQMP